MKSKLIYSVEIEDVEYDVFVELNIQCNGIGRYEFHGHVAYDEGVPEIEAFDITGCTVAGITMAKPAGVDAAIQVWIDSGDALESALAAKRAEAEDYAWEHGEAI